MADPETPARSDRGATLEPGPHDIVAAGPVQRDDPDKPPVAFRLRVGLEVRRRGNGPIELMVIIDDLDLESGSLVWLVTTNKGWVHLRGVARETATGVARPFRADLCSAVAAGVPGADVVALRVYATGADPNIDSPTHKVRGQLPRGSVRLGG